MYRVGWPLDARWVLLVYLAVGIERPKKMKKDGHVRSFVRRLWKNWVIVVASMRGNGNMGLHGPWSTWAEEYWGWGDVRRICSQAACRLAIGTCEWRIMKKDLHVRPFLYKMTAMDELRGISGKCTTSGLISHWLTVCICQPRRSAIGMSHQAALI